MKICTNKLMEKRLKGKSIAEWIATYPLVRGLKTELKGGLVEVDGKVFLATYYKARGPVSNDDPAGAEMYVNGFHIDFYTSKKNVTDYALQQGLVFAFQVKDLLVKQFPKSKFKIMVSTDEGEDSFPEVCTFGFYKIRPNEIWLDDDLEIYKSNGLFIIFT